MEKESFLPIAAIVGIVAIVAVVGTLNITGGAVWNAGPIIDKTNDGPCAVWQEQCIQSISVIADPIEQKSTCQQCCGLEFACRMQECNTWDKDKKICMEKGKYSHKECLFGCEKQNSNCYAPSTTTCVPSNKPCCDGYNNIGCLLVACDLGQQVCGPDCVISIDPNPILR